MFAAMRGKIVPFPQPRAETVNTELGTIVTRFQEQPVAVPALMMSETSKPTAVSLNDIDQVGNMLVEADELVDQAIVGATWSDNV